MGSLTKLEMTLDELLDKKAPVKIPPNGRKSLAGALWWIALIIGILDLWGAIALWSLGHTADRFIAVYNAYVGPTYATAHLGLFYYLSLISMSVVGVLLLIATPSLKTMSKHGWDMLFYASLFEAAVAVLRLFSNVGGGVLNFFWAAVGAVIGAWLLFQVRDNFVGHATVSHHTAATATEHHSQQTSKEHDKDAEKDADKSDE